MQSNGSDSPSGRRPATGADTELGSHAPSGVTSPGGQRARRLARSTAAPHLDPVRPNASSPANQIGFPRPLTGIIGREREGEQIAELLRADETRLVTLSGPGGVGKTRLALHVADRIAADLPTPVSFVPLDAVAEPALVLPTIGRAIGVRDGGGRSLIERIAALFGSVRRLLVLDNFEHLLAAAPDVASLLAWCPQLSILVTSRAILRITGEQVIQLTPLTTPPMAPPESPEGILAFSAAALFVVRATAIHPEFALTADSAPAVAEICRRLDGLPLAIELAAARSRVLSPEALLARLEPRLPVLTGGARDQPARLRTMRAAIAWSYDLLGPEEQTLFRRLSVFAGGFSLDAASWVIGDGSWGMATSPIPHQPSPPDLDLLEALVDRSLVRLGSDSGAESRFAMLDTIRAYGEEQLLANGDEALARERHARYFLERVEQNWPTAFAATLDDWLRRLDQELPNLRLALAWFRASGQPNTVLRLAVALRKFLFVRGHAREGRDWLADALAEADDPPEALRATALLIQGEMTLLLGRFLEAESPLLACLALSQANGDRANAAWALNALGMAASGAGDFDVARERLREAIAYAGTLATDDRNVGLDDGPSIAGLASFNLGMAAMGKGELDLAEEHFTAALGMQHESGNLWGAGFSLWGLGDVARDRGNESQALAYYRESLGLARDFGDKQLLNIGFASLAALALTARRAEQAAVLFGAAEALRDAIGIPIYRLQQPHESAVRSALDPAALERRWAEGRGLSLDDAMAFALATASPPQGLMQPSTGREIALTPREADVLRLLAQGLKDRAIAEELFISPRTVGGHVTNIIRKLGVETRRGVRAYALAHHLD
jgi:predicted ATPase/DNA-binding CsgD family transcriptional regulator